MADDLSRAVNRLAAAVEQLAGMVQGARMMPDEPCARCNGKAQWAPGVPCEACGGTGRQPVGGA